MLPRAEARVSKQEMERRYAAVRENMRHKGLETLLVSGVRFVAAWGYLRYLTNWAEPFAGEYLLFPLEGEPVFFARTSERVHLIREVLGLQCQLGSTVPVVAGEIQKRKLRCVGLCSLRTMLADFYVGLTEAVPECELVEAAAAVDDVRMIKSAEELEWVRKSASLGDTAHRVFCELVQDGMTEHQIFSELDHIVKQAGAETTYFMTGAGKNPILRFMDMATHRYEHGDLILFNAEVAGPGGYFTQLVRSVSLGSPRTEVARSYQVASARLQTQFASRPFPGSGHLRSSHH
jgi:Xaa-Pro aminopeptidase